MKIYLGEPSEKIKEWCKAKYGPKGPGPLCFTAQQANSSVKLQNVAGEYQTSTDGKTWTDYTLGTEISLPNVGDKVYFGAKTENQTCWNSNYNRKYTMTGEIAASGNIMSLLKKDYSVTSLAGKDFCFAYLFSYNDSLVQAPPLPVTTLASSCYSYMFFMCSSLTQAPELPATTLADSCYSYMFYNCTSLTQAPELPAMELAYECYTNMFYGCTSLVQAPTLPAETLADYCYSGMFQDCESLTQAPALPATTLASNCYDHMFYGCTSLVQSPVLPAAALTVDCYSNMFFGCTSLTQAPELPATTLADGCYSDMFFSCSKFSKCYMKSDMRYPDNPNGYQSSVHGDTTKEVEYTL